MKQTRPKIEKRGEHGACEVSGWRYEDDSRWHVKVWPENKDVRRNVYEVVSGVLEPHAVSPEEAEAVLALIARWEKENHRIGLANPRNPTVPV